MAVAHMSPISRATLRVMRKYPTNKSEAKCLEVLIDADIMNAYEIWKESGYKHYATILRAVKKLKEKGLINKSLYELNNNAIYYAICFGGKILHYLISGKEYEAINLLKNESRKFNDISEILNVDDYRIYFLSALYDNIISNTTNNIKYDIEREVVKTAGNMIGDIMFELVDDLISNKIEFEDEYIQIILMLSKKHSWIHDIAITELKKSQDYHQNVYNTYQTIIKEIEI